MLIKTHGNLLSGPGNEACAHNVSILPQKSIVQFMPVRTVAPRFLVLLNKTKVADHNQVLANRGRFEANCASQS